MVILEDTRNQPGKHAELNKFLTASGLTVERSKLYVGDYMLANRGNIAVDTKQNVMELIMDMHQEHRRFRDECIRAQNAGIQLVVLVEEALPGGRLENWRSPRWKETYGGHVRGEPMTRTDPAALRRALITMQQRYGVKFRFCHRKDAGRELLRYLGVVTGVGSEGVSPRCDSLHAEVSGHTEGRY